MSHFNARNWLLDRRHVLRGVGASMALPLLDCMLPARPTEGAGKPKRSVFIYIPNGVNTLVVAAKPSRFRRDRSAA